VLVVFAAVTAVGWFAWAGDLEPPGPPAPTPKPLSEIEPRMPISSLPFTITDSGSYYLTETLTGAAGVDGITIDADDVTLDLNGFTLISGGGPGFGVVGNGTRKNLTVKNGNVTGWGSAGVWLLQDDNSVVLNVRAEGNAFGFLVGSHSLILDSVAKGNGSDGFQINSGTVVRGCVAVENARGFLVNGGNVTLTDCTARDNTGRGFSIGSFSTLSNCTAASNDGEGIQAANGSTVTGCTVAFSGGDGIQVVANGGGRIEGNLVYQGNTNDGIEVTSACLVAGNVVYGAEAGILATGTRNRIDGNHVRASARDIDVDGTDNIIVRNTAYGVGIGYDIAAGNEVGAIVASPVGAGAWDNFD
jgi:parallel beta-helix repeat protein